MKFLTFFHGPNVTWVGARETTVSFFHIMFSSGRGVRIFRRDEDVYAECLSEAPVFIQSPIHAVKSHDHPATVYRLPSGAL